MTQDLKAERDEYRRLSDQYSDMWRRERDRADALAAHVSVLESIINGSSLTDRPHVMSALNTSPDTSLARVIAQAKAEALEAAAPVAARKAAIDIIGNAASIGATRIIQKMEASIIHEAAEYRRQAEGMTCPDEGCPHYGTPHAHTGEAGDD